MKDAWGPISTPELEAMAAGEAITAARREAANYSPVVDEEHARFLKRERLDLNCARCAHAHGFNAERQGAWCSHLRHMVGTWHPVRCNAYQAAD